MFIKFISKKKTRAQAMVEFALVLPFLLTMFMGVVELGFIINDYMSLVQANAAAARYGSKLLGNPDANDLIVGRLLDSLGHLDNKSLTIKDCSGGNLGMFTKSSDGTISYVGGNPTTFNSNTFYMYDNNTPNVTADDVPVSCTNVRASYVKLSTTYDHAIIIPGANIVTTDSKFPLDVTNVYPCSAMSINTSDPNINGLSGACPITVMDQTFVVGKTYTLKGTSDVDPDRPGNFGWINLDPSEPGNKNENIADWIIGPDSPEVSVPAWLGGFTGQRNAAVIKLALNKISSRYIVIFIHDSHSGTGANLQYHETSMAVFKIENFTEQDSSGNPYLEITGTFVKRL